MESEHLVLSYAKTIGVMCYMTSLFSVIACLVLINNLGFMNHVREIIVIPILSFIAAYASGHLAIWAYDHLPSIKTWCNREANQ